MVDNQASPERIDQALAARSVTSSVAGSEQATNFTAPQNFGELIAFEENSLYVAGRRLSGVRRTRYSYTEHFNAARKYMRFLMNVLKLFILVFVYVVVKHIEVTQKADQRRKAWTLSVLKFYNYIFFVTICLFLAMRVTKKQSLAIVIFGLQVAVALIFAYQSIVFFINGESLYADLPDSETERAPESTFLYVTYVACYICNLFFILCFLYVTCYLAFIAFMLRDVLFYEGSGVDDDQVQSLRIQRQASNMRRLEAIRSHRKPVISRLFVRSDLTCTICISEFDESEDIIVLECHESHIYHYDCIENWIARGNRECPVCRKVIHFEDG